MQIYFCEKCSARLSNGDIQRGDAVVYEGEVYCYHCVPEGVDPDSLPKPKRKGSAFNIPAARRRPGSKASITGPKRRPGSKTNISGARRRPGSGTNVGADKRQTPGSTRTRRKPSSSRTRPPSARLRPDRAAFNLTPKSVILIAAALGVAFATAAFFAMRMLG